MTLRKPLPKWIWHPDLQRASTVSLSRRFQLDRDQTSLYLFFALTGGVAIELDGRMVAEIPESPESLTRFERILLTQTVLAAGEHTLALHIHCSAPMPVAPVSIHLSERLVGCIAFLQGDGVYVPSDAGWTASEVPAKEVCLYGEEPYGDLEQAPEWFIAGGFEDIVAAPVAGATVIGSAHMEIDARGSELLLKGAGSGHPAVKKPATTERYIFYHLRKQTEWRQMRELVREMDLAGVPAAQIDLGREYNARMRWRNDSLADVTVLWQGAESLPELEHYEACITEVFRIEAGSQAATLPQGMRYIKLYVFGPEGQTFELGLEFDDVSVAMDQAGRLESDNPLLDRIYETSSHTSRICHQIGLWDGIKRDRLNWVYDFYLAGKADYLLWDNLSVLRRSIVELGQGTPYGYWMNSLASYTLWWLNNIWEYYFFTGDRDFVVSLKDVIGRHVGWVKENIDPLCGTFDEAVSSLIEWVPMSKQEERHCLHALLAITSGHIALLAAEVPELQLPELPKPTVAEAEYLQSEALITKLLGIKAGFVSEVAAFRFLSSVHIEDPITPLSAYWLAEVLSENEMQDKAWEVVAKVWGSMLDHGATTFWESVTLEQGNRPDFHDALTTYRAYGSYRISLCHSWASTPVQWIARFVAGIEPLEPGYRKVRIKPSPILGMQRFLLQTPTPHGMLVVDWDQSRSGPERAKTQIPQGIEVVVEG